MLKYIKEFGLLVDIEYKDGFSISVDVDLILGRSAYVHIKVVSLKGKARLEFKREPFTHWYFQFVNEPEIEFSAASQFESKQIPQLTSLIINQVSFIRWLLESQREHSLTFAESIENFSAHRSGNKIFLRSFLSP